MPENILVVEDEHALYQTLSYNLERDRYSVKTISNSVYAINIARRESPDMIFLDLMLPGLNRFEIIPILRNDMKTLILILTTHDDEIDRG